MKKTISIIFLILIMLFSLGACTPFQDSKKETVNEIPEQSITYTNFTLGNVIQDGKRAMFLNFASDYKVTKMEIAGTLLDKNETALHSFDTSMAFANPSYNPEMYIRIESGLVNYIKSVSFTKIKAYTTQELNASTENKLKHLSTLDTSTIGNYFASGSTITVTNGKINIQMDANQNGCGFRWDLSEVNLKSNTKYLVKFYNINIADIHNETIQIETTWVDSTYTWPRYYHTKGKRFDIISSGQISMDYYQFLNLKAYDEYTMEFSFSHNVDNATNKNLYFLIWGVKGQLLIEKLSIYEMASE